MTALFIYYLLFPALALYGCNRYGWLNSIGSVMLCYGGGIGITQLLPLLTSMGWQTPVNNSGQEMLMSVCIVLALPLLLFSTDAKSWLRLGPTTLLSMASAVFAVTLLSFIAGLMYYGVIDQMWQLVGLITALYLGGTPNMAAAKEALNVDNTLFLQVHTYDTVLTLAYIIFMITIAQRVFQLFLPKFSVQLESGADGATSEVESVKLYAQLLRLTVWKPLMLALVLAVAIVAAVVGSANVIFGQQNMAFVMVAITVLSVGASFNRRIRNIPNTFELGMHVVLVFRVVVGALITRDLFQTANYPLMTFILTVVFGSLLCTCSLHVG